MPAILTGPYDNAEYVLNLTRSIINDAALSIAGNIFADNQPYTFPMLNAAYRNLQEILADAGVETFIRTTQLLLIPVVDPVDPGTQIQISYVGTFNGSAFFENPQLPWDMMMPLRLRERESGTFNYFSPMYPVNDGLPSVVQTPNLRYWDWQTDKIYMPGATQINDVELRYLAYQPDLLDGTSPVLVLRCAQPLAYLTAFEFARSRGSALADTFKAQAMEMLDEMIDRTAKRTNRGNHRRMPYGQSMRAGWSQW